LVPKSESAARDHSGTIRYRASRSADRLGRKPPLLLLRLLKVLVALGGRDVEIERMTAALWPDEAGRPVRRRFDTALYRLRSLLGADVVRTNGEVVTLNSDAVEVDAFAFRNARSIVQYDGPFLPGDMDSSWSIPMREMLAERFRSEVARSAEALMERGDAVEALAQCARAMTIEPLSEVLCRLALRASLQSGRRDEGKRLYDLHAAAMRNELDIAPAAETQVLRQALIVEQASA